MSFLQPLTRSAREGVGQPVLRKDDARLLVGDGCYSDDVNLPGQAYACFVRSPHAHARVGRIDDGRRARHAGRDRRAHRRGRRRRRHRGRSRTVRCRPIPTRRSLAGPRRRPFRRAASADARRSRALRGRGRGDGRRRDAGRGARRRRARRRGLDAAARRDRQPGRGGRGAPQPLRRHRRRTSAWTSDGGRPRGRRGAPSRAPPTWCGSRRGSSASPACRWSRARRSASGTRRAAATPFTPARAASGARRPGVAGALGVPRERGARGGARRRRQLRDAQQLLSGVRARRLGGAPPGPPGEVDGRPARGVPGRLPGPRPGLARRAGARRRRATSSALRGVNTSNVGAHAVSFHPLNKGMAIATTVYHVPGRGDARRAPWSPPRRPPRRIAAPAGPRSCSSWSG